jgi:site-specific DNA recombinase
MKTAIIYSRVSKRDQDYGRQLSDLERYAKKHSFKIVQTFTEKISGTKRTELRKEYTRMMEYLTDHPEVKNILVTELSRFGRLGTMTRLAIDELAERGINIYFQDRGINTLDKNGKPNSDTLTIIGILCDFAKREIDTLKQRIVSGLRHSASKGNIGGGAVKPYGFTSDENKKMILDPEEAFIVKLIFQKYLEGLGTGQIATLLNEQGISTKYNKAYGERSIMLEGGIAKKGNDFKWKDGTVYHMLTNTLYKGERKLKNEVFKVDAIIDPVTFEKVQIRLKQNYNKKGINQKYDNVLKDVIKCGCCGESYTLHKKLSAKRQKYTENSYKCLSKRYKSWCGNPSVNIDKLNTAIYTESFGIIMNDSMNSKKANEFNLKSSSKKKEAELANIRKEIETLNKRIQSLLNMALEESISKDVFRAKNTELNSELAKKQEALINKTEEINRLQSVRGNNIVEPLGKRLSEYLNMKNGYTIEYTPELFKAHAKDYIEYVKIFDVKSEKILKHFIKPNAKLQDEPVLVEIKPRLSDKLQHFVISRFTRNYMKVKVKTRKRILTPEESEKAILKGNYAIQKIDNQPFIKFQHLMKLT